MQLHLLDGCLDLLEEAHLRDEQVVSYELWTTIRDRVPTVLPDMWIAEAIELVFREQEQCLRGGGQWPGSDDDDDGSLLCISVMRGDDGLADVREPLDERSARALTEQIRTAANRVSLLLLEAHQGRAWLALAYRSWEQYVNQEFGLSRTRSYELLDHGRLIRSIQAVTGMTDVPDVIPYTARRIKPQMRGLIASLRARVAGKPPEEIPSIIDEVVRIYRQNAGSMPSSHGFGREVPATALDRLHEAADLIRAHADRGWPERLDIALLAAVIDCIAAMPPAPRISARIPNRDEGQMLSNLDCAVRWLTEFASLRRQRLAARPDRAGLLVV